MNNAPISIYCPFCHRFTSLTPAKSQYEAIALWVKDLKDRWWIGICNNCHNAVLVHEYEDYGDNIRDIYPQPLPSPTDERIPEHIRRDIDEAKMCFSVGCYRACAVMARRAIQNACIDKGADKNKKLIEQIEEIANEGVITNDIKEWANVVRWVGNDAAHPDKNEVTKDDAEDILKLAEQFMHVIYVAPAIAKEQRTKRGK